MKINKHQYKLSESLRDYLELCADDEEFKHASFLFNKIDKKLNELEKTLYNQYEENGLEYMLNKYCENNDQVVIFDNLKRFAFITTSRSYTNLLKRKEFTCKEISGVKIYQQ